jgi:ribosomal protein S4
MHKFYKQKLYKKYHDEIWGQIVTSRKFSYNKKSILLHYKDTVLKRRLRIKTKFKYFRRGFLKNLNYTLFTFKDFRKKIRLLNFAKKRSYILSSSMNSLTKSSKGFFKKSTFFKKMKPLVLLGLNLLHYFKNNIKITDSKLFFCKNFLFRENNLSILWRNYFFSKKRTMYKAAAFLRSNNLQFAIKKKLNLKRQKTFFYSIHIAAPRKKNKKWSLFGLKNIYYKKVSLFFGFKKIVDFLKAYNISSKVFGSNSYSIFLMLEGRLENFLLRLNIFPSIYFVKKFIQYGNVFVNNRTVNYCSFNLNFNEIVSLNKKYHKYFYFLLKSRLRSKKVLLNYPSFMEVDYKLFTAMLIRNPTTESLTSPVSFDIYTKFLTVNR